MAEDGARRGMTPRQEKGQWGIGMRRGDEGAAKTERRGLTRAQLGWDAGAGWAWGESATSGCGHWRVMGCGHGRGMGCRRGRGRGSCARTLASPHLKIYKFRSTKVKQS